MARPKSDARLELAVLGRILRVLDDIIAYQCTAERPCQVRAVRGECAHTREDEREAAANERERMRVLTPDQVAEAYRWADETMRTTFRAPPSMTDDEWFYGNTPAGLRMRAAIELGREFDTPPEEWLV